MNVIIKESIIDVSHLPYHFRNKSSLMSPQKSVVVDTKDSTTEISKVVQSDHLIDTDPNGDLKEFLLKAERYYIN